MLLSEETLDIIAESLQMPEHQKLGFIDQIRGTQAEIFWKSFFMYYEIYKTPAELNYLEKVTAGLEVDKNNLQKLANILAAEAENNKQFIEFIATRVQNYIVKVLESFMRDISKEAQDKILADIFENVDLLAMVNKSRANKSKEPINKSVN